jgi:flagellar hook-associated protein 3 FlgL
MRVASNSYTESMLNQFNTLISTEDNLQSEVSTGLSVTAPSDNPTAMTDTLNDLANQAAQTQYSSNISSLQTTATSVYNAMDSLQNVVSSADEIATSATSGTAPQSKLDNYASQVQQLIQQAVSLANTKDSVSGQYLFGGTGATSAPFTTTTDASTGDVTAVTYQGNSAVNQVPIGTNTTVTVDVPGVNTSGSGTRGLFTDSQSGADLFNHLIALQKDLTSGDTSAITTDSANLQKDENNLTYQVASNGAVQTRLNNAATIATNQGTSLSTDITNASGADLVQTMVQLNQAQTSYQAALQSSAQIMQLSILNYLPT